MPVAMPVTEGPLAGVSDFCVGDGVGGTLSAVDFLLEPASFRLPCEASSFPHAAVIPTRAKPSNIFDIVFIRLRPCSFRMKVSILSRVVAR